MVDYLARPVVHEAFFKKYASKKFLKGECLGNENGSGWPGSNSFVAASILACQWAKKSAAMFGIVDIDLSLDQIS
jgi:G2/mitotic-specific cyclin 2